MKRYPLVTPEYSENLFTVENTIAFDLDIPFTKDSWNGRIKACRGIDASLSAKEIAAFEKEHVTYLKSVPNEFTIKHYATILDLKKKEVIKNE